MALIQLVAQGQIDRDLQNRAVTEIINLPLDRIGWNKNNQVIVTRNGDVITKSNLRIRLGAAPEGYRWKRCWPLHFVKNLTLSIGGQTMFETGSEALRMKYLIDGLQTSFATGALSANAPIEMSQTLPECIFDYNEEERTLLSARPHEILFEPLNFSELIHMVHKIPLICLAFHEVRFHLQTSSLEDCLEPIGEAPPPLPEDRNALIQTCDFSVLYTFLDNEERRNLAQRNHETRIKQYQHSAEIFEKPAGNILRTYIRAGNYCSAAYIWITDEAGNELPNQVLDRVKIKFNGNLREDLSGFESRMGVRQLLPHPTLPNTKSQNLYYISYYPGRRDETGFEQGANFARLDSYGMDFTFFDDAPQRMKINIVHRSQNILRIMHGMAGVVYGLEQLQMSERPLPPPAPAVPAPIVFENTDQLIDIPEDEKACMITYVDFKEGEVVQQCLACKKNFTSEALDTWLKQRPYNKRCVHCQRPYNATTFRKGKAHLTFQVEIREEQPLIVPAARPGILNRALAAIGFAQHHPHDA